jgi:hypothetical protein
MVVAKIHGANFCPDGNFRSHHPARLAHLAPPRMPMASRFRTGVISTMKDF